MMDFAQKKGLYEEIVRSHSASIYRFAYRLSGSHDAAEDLVQETYYEAWKSINSLKDASAAKFWIFAILRHRFSHWVRSKQRHPTELADPVEIQEIAQEIDFAPVEFENDTLLQKALDSLAPDYKVVFLLVFLEGWSCREAAEFLGIPIGTVLSRIHRSRNYLRAFMKEYSK